MDAPSTRERVGVGILGGGFGMGLAQAAARAGSEVTVWSRTRRAPVSADIQACDRIAEVARHDLILVAVPSLHIEAVIGELGRHLDGRHLLVHVSRGLEGDRLTTVCDRLRRRTPSRRVGCLAGPLAASVLVEGNPGGAIVGSDFPEVPRAVRAALGGPSLRVYDTNDRVGVEIASALTGPILFVLGYAQGLGYGPSTVGMLAARGVAEVARVGVALGGRHETFAGLACLGDLVAAMAGDARPELQLGRLVAAGRSLEDALGEVGAHVESTHVAGWAAAYGRREHVELPIVSATADLIAGKLSAEAAIERLMSRQVGRE